MMPPKAAENRSKQMAALAGVLYEKRTNKEIGDLLSNILKDREVFQKEFDEWEQAVVREADWDYRRHSSMSKELAQREAKLMAEGYDIWVRKKKKKKKKREEWLETINNRFEDEFEHNLGLSRIYIDFA